MAIYRETTGGESMDYTYWSEYDHDTTVWEDTACFDKYSAGGVYLREAGHYLAMYNDGAEISGTLNRCAFLGRLVLNGSAGEIEGSMGAGYIKGTEGCDECWKPYSAVIFEASADDLLELQMVEQVGTTPSPTRIADNAGLQLLKLDDTWAYLRLNAERAGYTQDAGDTIIWFTEREVDSSVFSHSGANMTLGDIGWYLCCYNLKWDNNSVPPQRATVEAYLYNATTYEIIPQSYSSDYNRSTGGTEGVTGAIFLIETTQVDEVFQLVTNGRGFGATFGDGTKCEIQIVKLPDSINVLDIVDGTGSQTFDTTEDPFDWDVQNSVDSAFDHSTGTDPDDVDILKPGPFLFTGNFYGYRSSGTNRYNTKCRFRDGGTALKYGIFGDYHRQGATVSYHGGSHGVLLPWLSINDAIDMSREDTSTSTGTAPTSAADQMGVQAIYLPSIFPAYWQNGGFFAQQISGVT
jgi:hypothetical protein